MRLSNYGMFQQFAVYAVMAYARGLAVMGRVLIEGASDVSGIGQDTGAMRLTRLESPDARA